MGSLHSEMLVLLYYYNSFQVNRKMLKHMNILYEIKRVGYKIKRDTWLCVDILKYTHEIRRNWGRKVFIF